MNCWRFSPDIFLACHRIKRSERNELELPDAVTYSMTQLGQRYRIIPSSESVLDLSHRDDIACVAKILENVEVYL
jgi:glucose-1-phosphate thymidylyltransferase